MKFVSEEDFPEHLRQGKVHPLVQKWVSAVENGAMLRLDDNDRAKSGHTRLEFLAQRMRKVSARRGFKITAFERVVLKDTDIVVPKDEFGDFESGDLEVVMYVRRRD